MQKIMTTSLMIMLMISQVMPALPTIEKQYKDFVVLIPSYNNAQWYEINLHSVFSQNYPEEHFRVVYVDDCSSDDTLKLAKQYCKQQEKEHLITFISHETRQGALKSRYDGVHTCQNHEIIVVLDGDDWLAHQNVLQLLNQVYQDKNVWMTYGRYIRWCEHCEGKEYPVDYQLTDKCNHKYLGWCRPLPDKGVIQANQWREHIKWVMAKKGGWLFGHLRTYYAALYKKLHKQDLMSKGKFYFYATDMATMIPMAEMAGKHVRFINEPLYVYNRANPINVSKEVQHHKLGPVFYHYQQRKYGPLAKL